MIYLALGAGLLALLVWVGRGQGRARPTLRIANALIAVLAAAGAVGFGLFGRWPVSLALIVLAAFLGQSARRGGALPPDGQASGGMNLDQARAILGVGEDATRADIDAAWRRLIRRAHPDQGGTSGLAAQLNAARDRLVK
ncbi:MAG: molecular chaperone DnaJ [Caulobacteraceae bacterium]